MSYIVLARKWRPQGFDDLTGQDTVVKTLKNALAQDRLAHAYLFCGPRGVGKTTMARLLAKAVNCLVSPGTHPCGTCEACTSIASGQDVDVLELDAASRRKVEDIEPLIDSSRYLPQRSPRKVFIVDEAHMLSKTAWNALLKTLEEPPPHVLFIFATTEPSKVIETVRSRCQRFDFKRITEIDIAGKLRRIADAEGAQVEEEVFAEIASRATGGMRDAETLLDQSLSAAPEDRALAADDLEEDGLDLGPLLLAAERRGQILHHQQGVGVVLAVGRLEQRQGLAEPRLRGDVVALRPVDEGEIVERPREYRVVLADHLLLAGQHPVEERLRRFQVAGGAQDGGVGLEGLEGFQVVFTVDPLQRLGGLPDQRLRLRRAPLVMERPGQPEAGDRAEAEYQ